VLALAAPLPMIAVAAGSRGCSCLVAVIGAASLVSEVVGDTALQRSLDPASSLGPTASCSGGARRHRRRRAACGSCVSLVGLDGTLVLVGTVAAACGGAILAAPNERAGLAMTA
jgi:hypothetical protein